MALLSPGGDSMKGAILEPFSCIIKMKYAGAASASAYFQGGVYFATPPFLCLKVLFFWGGSAMLKLTKFGRRS